MDKLKMHSPDFTEHNVARLAELFPNCVTEAETEDGQLKKVVDFDQLRQELSESVVEGPRERFQLNWPGKKQSLLAANAPVAKTFLPCRDESVDFATTKNLFIEGDNLEALKLLQETYLNKVKLIYIDPPYNTGKDFIYSDRFAASAGEYGQDSGQVDEEGFRLVANNESNGRFHSDWLSMIYSRLRLARNLLRDDGVMFISIDDGEVGNLRKLGDEVFGEANLVANIVWQKKYAVSADAKGVPPMHDHILLYRKSNAFVPNLGPRSEKQDKHYKNLDNDPRGPWRADNLTRAEFRQRDVFPIVSPKTGEEFWPPKGASWRHPQDKIKAMIADNRIWFGKDGKSRPVPKRFLSEVKQGVVISAWWDHSEAGHNDMAKKEMQSLFDGSSPFDTPKPTKLVQKMIQLATSREKDIVLDFFAGSGTTADAVIRQNAEDGGTRCFVMVQLPERCDEKSDAFKAGYATIAEISKERIRRAGKKIKDKSPLTTQELDVGFRVLKVDTSNMKDVYYTPDGVKQGDLLDQVENIKEDRTPEDLLFQVLLDWGVYLTLPISEEAIEGKTVFFVDGNALAACFDKDINEELVKSLATRNPLRAVFRDSGYGNDSVKINVEQIFKLISPSTEVKSI